jgi:hypothetical protein
MIPAQPDVKTSPLPTLVSSEAEPATTIRTCLELDRALHKIELQCASKRPVIVSLYAYSHHVEMGLGLSDSFVSIQRCEPSVGPRLITVGEVPPECGAVFSLLRGGGTEVPARNLVPASTARAVFRQFFNTGVASTDVGWEAP